MALYAFDGTWNVDKPGSEHDANVTWFHGAYAGPKHYIGWDLDLPNGVQTCFHAMALDERRIDFKLHPPDARVDDANQPGRLFEVWFRGVHSDVGVGNDCPELSSIAPNWMFAHAAALGSDTHYNNPPDNVMLVDDRGAETGRFVRA